MAEIAVGAIVAEQVISTTVEAGAAAAIARPTQPIKATFRQLTINAPEPDKEALTRSQHTVTIVGNKAFIFGGKQADGAVCTTDFHSIVLPTEDTEEHSQYTRHTPQASNPLGTGSVPLPSARFAHAACRRGPEILVHGGKGADGSIVDEGSCIWAWHSEKAQWRQCVPTDVAGQRPGPRAGHRIFLDEKQDILVLHGGESPSREGGTQETWAFVFEKGEWVQLPSVPTPPLSSAFINSTLYSISGGGSEQTGIVETLDLHDFMKSPSSRQWSAIAGSAQGKTPDHSAREWSMTVPVTTGFGRYYLLNFLGARVANQSSSASSLSNMWSLQIPSERMTGAGVKDLIREKLPNTDSGSFSWYEVEVPENQPEPRSNFGADSTPDGNSVVIWSGTDSEGVTTSSGWLVKLQ